MIPITKKNNKMLLYFSPLLLIIIFIYLIPIGNTFYYSFFNVSDNNVTFAGLSNFIKIKDLILPTTWRTIIWTMGSIVPSIVIGLLAALVFQEDFRGKKIWICICMLGYTIPLIIVAVSWDLMFQPDFGLINVFLIKLGIIDKPILFLSYEKAMTSVIVARAWRAMPFAFITYYAALKSIPDELYEAANVDGVNTYQKLIYITLPMLKSVTATITIILTVWTFLVFDIIFAMTGGGPVDATKILPVQIYRELFSLNDMGTSSSLSVIAIVVLFLLTTLYWKFFNEGVKQ